MQNSVFPRSRPHPFGGRPQAPATEQPRRFPPCPEPVEKPVKPGDGNVLQDAATGTLVRDDAPRDPVLDQRLRPCPVAVQPVRDGADRDRVPDRVDQLLCGSGRDDRTGIDAMGFARWNEASGNERQVHRLRMDARLPGKGGDRMAATRDDRHAEEIGFWFDRKMIEDVVPQRFLDRSTGLAPALERAPLVQAVEDSLRAFAPPGWKPGAVLRRLLVRPAARRGP